MSYAVIKKSHRWDNMKNFKEFDVELTENRNICACCEADPCICDDSHGYISESADKHKVVVTVSEKDHPMVSKRSEKQQKRVIVTAKDKDEAVVKAKKFYTKQGYHVHDTEYHSVQPKTSMKTEEVLDELSTDTLASYKKKAGESATAADKAGDTAKGNKRFKGIMKATFKQFANDAK